MEQIKLKLERPWEEVKDKIKEHNIDITDDDLDYKPGEEGNLLDRLGKKLSKSREEVKILIESLSSNRDMAG